MEFCGVQEPKEQTTAVGRDGYKTNGTETMKSNSRSKVLKMPTKKATVCRRQHNNERVLIPLAIKARSTPQFQFSVWFNISVVRDQEATFGQAITKRTMERVCTSFCAVLVLSLFLSCVTGVKDPRINEVEHCPAGLCRMPLFARVSASKQWQPVIQCLVRLVDVCRWEETFNEAISKSKSYGVDEWPADLNDFNDFVEWLNQWTNAPPYITEKRVTSFYPPMRVFYLILGQEQLQNVECSVIKNSQSDTFTLLDCWVVMWARSWNSAMDTSESAKYVDTFKNDPEYTVEQYMAPPSGYLTFNQFFARHVKPGFRPIASIGDTKVLVAPTDSVYIGQWNVDDNSEIIAKGIKWSIEQLLQDSEYKDEFKGGIFTHSFLNVYNYHRLHSPVEGKILETKLIEGKAAFDVYVEEELYQNATIKFIEGTATTGFQFTQIRGLIVIDSPIGLVACLPIGMAQVSSVVITAEVGRYLYKGEEMAYFQFGGSDFVLVFQEKSKVILTAQVNQMLYQGNQIGLSYLPI